MALKIARVLFVLSSALMGGFWAFYYLEDQDTAGWATMLPWTIVGVIAGAAISLLTLFLLRFVTQEVYERISPAIVAVFLGLGTGYLLAKYILSYWNANDTAQTFLMTSLVLVFGFVGIMLGLTRASNWENLVRAVHRRDFAAFNGKLVDTSVIIDGRIADICKTGFIEGRLLIPRFVLKELQNIADSSDVLRRARGRRGLDILAQLHEVPGGMQVEIIEDDPLEVREVDGKLVRLAREYGAKIVTNDLNLNKVAQIEGVHVLNINDLANALKPAVLPDESMQVRIVKEGKEAFQGVGYLDDGTMVVVDGGKEHVGRDVDVVITSVLQTTAGRMIFGKLGRLTS